MSCLLGLGALQWREVNQKPSAFESPPRLAWGALRTSALGPGDTPSSHINLPDPWSPRTQGWCYKSCHLQSWLAGAENRPALDRSSATGWKNRSCPQDCRPGRQISGLCWCRTPGVQRLGKGAGNLWNLTPLAAEETSQAGEFGEAGLLLLECVPTNSGFAGRLACGKEVRRGWGAAGSRRGTRVWNLVLGVSAVGGRLPPRSRCRRDSTRTSSKN